MIRSCTKIARLKPDASATTRQGFFHVCLGFRVNNAARPHHPVPIHSFRSTSYTYPGSYSQACIGEEEEIRQDSFVAQGATVPPLAWFSFTKQRPLFSHSANTPWARYAIWRCLYWQPSHMHRTMLHPQQQHHQALPRSQTSPQPLPRKPRHPQQRHQTQTRRQEHCPL